jgi:penicillin-binding protein 2
LLDKKSSYPLTNRAVSGVYPAASTFKAFSSMAGLQFGIIGPDTTHDCKGYWDAYGKQWGQKCWIYPGHHGVLGLEEAIKHSCDIYFYNVGADFYKAWQAEPAQARVDDYQNYVKTWGFGSVSGIDLPGEASGRIPDAAWKAQTFVDTPEEAQWQPGDMTNMCIGQGDILVTPLQICNGYAAIARRQMLTPHLFKSALDSDAAPVVTYTPIPPTTTPEVVPEHVKRVERGCEMVVTQTNLFDDLPIKVAGKSGTGEVSGKDDISWYVAYGPVEKPKYCVVCVVEQGGGGSTTAIQGVAQTFAKLYDTSAGSITLRSATNER